MPELVESIRQRERTVFLNAIPNSGKTKWLPAKLVARGYKVIVLSPQVADLYDVHDRLSAMDVKCVVQA